MLIGNQSSTTNIMNSANKNTKGKSTKYIWFDLNTNTHPASSKFSNSNLKQSFLDLNFRSEMGCEVFKLRFDTLRMGNFRSNFKSEILFFLVISDLKNQ